jgi:HK97 family phage portal protein
MKLFGLTVRSPFALVRKDTSVPSGGRWSTVGRSGRDWFPGAWQRNMECDEPNTVLAFSAVYACVSRISNDIAKMPLNLIRKDSDGIWQTVEAASPFWKVLRKPNGYQNRIQFFVTWLLSKLITGNAYVLKARDGRGIVVELYVLDPNKVKVRYTAAGEVFYSIAQDDLSGVRKETNVPASEIIHDLMNPLFHPLCGVSPLYACGLAATQGRRIQWQSATFFENGANPSGVLSVPGDISDETAEQWKTQWRANFSGANRGSVAILGNGVKYEKVSMSADEAQMIEQLRWTAEDVARAFGVPLYKINAGPVPVSNNVEALNAQYYSDTLQTLIEAIELCIDEGLDLSLDLGVEFDLDVLLRMDSATQIDTLSKGIGAAIYAPNEARAKLNLRPVIGGANPLIQQQNYSLEALAKRDASADPFGTATPPTPPPTPTESPSDEADDEPAEEKASGVDILRALMPEAA